MTILLIEGGRAWAQSSPAPMITVCAGTALPDTLAPDTLAPDTVCCATGASGFLVLPSGEVPLYPGSAGIDNRFEYRSNHPFCPDTIQFKIDILQSSASQVAYSGYASIAVCNISMSFPVADTATLAPGFGMGHFADPTGNVFLLAGRCFRRAGSPSGGNEIDNPQIPRA